MLIIIIIIIIIRTHLEENSSIIVNPSNDHIRPRHLAIGWKSEGNPTSGLHADSKLYILRFNIKGPVDCVRVAELYVEAVRGNKLVVSTKWNRQKWRE